jgi:hypothetical protein
MAVADRYGLPVAVHVASASPHEVTLARDTVQSRFVADPPARLIGDKAYDSDKLDASLAEQGVELIAPHKTNRREHPRRTVVRCVATSGAGRSSGCSHGCSTSVASRLVMSITPATTWVVHLGCLAILVRQYF